MGFFEAEKFWIKSEWNRATNLLERIVRNTDTQKRVYPTGPIVQVIKISSNTSASQTIETEKPFLVYGGMRTSGGLIYIDTAGTERITFDQTIPDASKSVPIFPGSVIGTLNPEGKRRLVYFDTTTSLANGNYIFYGVNHPSEASFFVSPFMKDSTGFQQGTVRWASLEPTTNDQYVVFRVAPAVTVTGSVSITGSLPAGTNNIGDVDVLTLPAITGTVTTNAAAAVAGGYSADFRSALSTTVQSVKGSAGKLGGWYIYNPNASAAFVQIFNVSSGSVTLGTTTPTLSLGVPATSAANLMSGEGVDFGTAISIAATTTATGNTAPGTGLVTNILFK
jgi:hypothetical protein